MDNNKYRHLSGFTLLETLVALSVLAISLGIAYQAFSSALQGSSLADDYAQASMYADSHLAEIGIRVDTLPSVSEGAYNNRYYWKLEVQALDASNNTIEKVNRYQIVLNVFWKSKKGMRSLKTMTFRLASA